MAQEAVPVDLPPLRIGAGGILRHLRAAEHPDIVVKVDSKVWKEVAADLRNPALSLVRDMEKEGGTLKIVRFLNLFRE